MAANCCATGRSYSLENALRNIVKSNRIYIYKFALLVGLNLGVCLGFPMNAAAQATAEHAPEKRPHDAVQIQLSQWKVQVDATGTEHLVDAKKLKPGDVMEYRASYSNVSKRPVKSLMAVLPLPEGLDYLADSSKPTEPAAEAATQDGKFAAQPLMHVVKGKDGKPRTEPVPYDAYRSLRWSVAELAPGKSFEIRARARVSTTLPEPRLPLNAASAPVPLAAAPDAR